ncbi:MAG: AraC family transcriptional regulator [Eubacteriales bacterium]|nr:AraC family transcriptional regulator [Eubacteriales bacterium]
MSNPYQNFQLNVSAEIHLDISRTADVVPLHSHGFYEILFVAGGDVQYLLEDRRFQLQRGDILLIPPGISHRPLFPENMSVPYERLALWLHSDFVEHLKSLNPDLDFAFQTCRARANYLLRTPVSTWSALGALFRTIYRESTEQKLGWDVAISAHSATLLVHLGRTLYYLEAVEPVTETDSLFDDLFQYVLSHYQERISLQTTAQQFLVSTSTVSHLFQKRLGISFYHFLTQRRLIAAKNAILSGASIQSVWEPCGFADYTTFYRSFRREYSLSPRDFIRQNQENRTLK